MDVNGSHLETTQVNKIDIEKTKDIREIPTHECDLYTMLYEEIERNQKYEEVIVTRVLRQERGLFF